MKRAPWLTLLSLALPCPVLAQGVLVAPHAVHIDHATRAGSITLFNPGSTPAEVTVSLAFGYPQTDSAGDISLPLSDSAPAGQPAATAWIQAFPRRVTVPPQQRQTVRLLATPPQGLADGEYWARVIIGAKGGQVPVAGITDTVAVRVGLTLEVRTVIALTYRKGALTTGLAAGPLRAAYESDSVFARMKLTRQGQSAYLGTARAEVVDSAGQVVGASELPVAVYYELDPRIGIPVGRLPAGRYRVRLEVASERTDLPPKVVLRAPAVRDSAEVEVR